MTRRAADIIAMMEQLRIAHDLAEQNNDAGLKAEIACKIESLANELNALFGFIPGKGSSLDYLPEWMNIPNISPVNGNPVAVIRLFHPPSGWEWYIAEADRQTREAFGLVVGQEIELGYFSLDEVAGVGPFRVERDLYFCPCPLKDIRRVVEQRRREEQQRAQQERQQPQEERQQQEQQPQEERQQQEQQEQVAPPLPAMHILFRPGGIIWTGDTTHFDEDEINRTIGYMALLAEHIERMGWKVVSMYKPFGGSLTVFLDKQHLPPGLHRLDVVIAPDPPDDVEDLVRSAYANPTVHLRVATPGNPDLARRAVQVDDIIRSALRIAREYAGDDPAAILENFDRLAANDPFLRGISHGDLWSPEIFLEQVGVSREAIERWLKAKYQSEYGEVKRRRKAQAEDGGNQKARKAKPRYQAGTLVVERGQPIQVMVGWQWRDATVHSVAGRNLIYQIEGGWRGKTPVAGLDITWRLAGGNA
jgi:DNA-binding transcriptional MerR regulator